MFGNDKIREKSLIKAIKLYEDVLEIYKKDEFKEKYAEVQSKLGMAYYRILQIRDNIKVDMEKALKSLNEAECIYEATDHKKYGDVVHIKGMVFKKSAKHNKKYIEESIKYFEICDKIFKHDKYKCARNYLEWGGAYSLLLEIDNKEIYANMVISYAKEALDILTTLNVDKFDLAECNRKLGIAYWRLSNLKDRKINLENAVSHFLKALKMLNDRPIDYGDVCNNLGIVYSKLSMISGEDNLSSRSIDIYNVSLEILKNYPLQYARTHYNLGIAYQRLAKSKEFKENINKSITHLDEALKIRNKDNYKFLYANTQYELSYSFIKLSKIENKSNNLKKAEFSLTESFDILNDGEHDTTLSECFSNFGDLYYELSKIHEKKYYLKKGLESIIKSIDLQKENQYRHANHQLQLGRIYCELSSIEEPIENLEKSNDTLNNAMQIFSKEGCRYYICRTNFYKGITFYHMSENYLDRRDELINESIIYYLKAIEPIKNGEYPLFCAKVKFHLANSYSKLDELSTRKSQELYKDVLNILKKENIKDSYQVVEERIKTI